MTSQDVEYVELYTSTKQPIIDYFSSLLGFAQVAESTDYDTDSVVLQQGEVQLVVTAGRGTHKFLDAHGDGIADIALTCEDVAATRNAAISAGAEVVGSVRKGVTVSAFGGVRHTLLPASANSGAWLPGRRARIDARKPPLHTAERIRMLDHVAICLERGTLEDYADFYMNAFGLARYSTEYVDFGDQAMDSIVVRNPSGGITFTLVAPDASKGAGQLDAFLSRNSGPGIQHLAFLVDEIIPAVREFRKLGVEFLQTPGSYYEMLTERFPDMQADIAGLRATHVLVDRDEWGYLLQLFTRSPHERNTLFYELIQRRGARGFGSANIRALYEAVDRDRLAAE
jgi:4-hydroxymandelate synthase